MDLDKILLVSKLLLKRVYQSRDIKEINYNNKIYKILPLDLVFNIYNDSGHVIISSKNYNGYNIIEYTSLFNELNVSLSRTDEEVLMIYDYDTIYSFNRYDDEFDIELIIPDIFNNLYNIYKLMKLMMNREYNISIRLDYIDEAIEILEDDQYWR